VKCVSSVQDSTRLKYIGATNTQEPMFFLIGAKELLEMRVESVRTLPFTFKRTLF
jgi:hypothetical protein